MSTYNDIGINNKIDWSRIRKLFIIGIFAACMVLIGDMLLGWGVHDTSVSGMEGFLSAYTDLSDTRIFWSAICGFIGIPLEAMCYFGIYRLIAPYSEKLAHTYRSGIIGLLAFAGCGVHVPCLAAVYVYKYFLQVSAEIALDVSMKFGLYFLLPGMIVFFVFWIIQHIAHIRAFAKEATPYPKWCWIFCPAVGMAITMLLKFMPETALRNAITAGWISIGNLWMFAGLLIMMKRAKSKDPKMAQDMMKLVRRYVKKHYPNEVETLMADTEKYYRQFKAECPNLGGNDNMLAENLDMGLIAFAAYEASGHRMGEEAIDELMEMRMEKLSKYGHILDVNKKWMIRIMEAYYKSYKKKLDKKLSSGEWGNTWGMEINPDGHDEGFAFTLIGCPIAEFAKKHGYMELMPHLCASDHALAEMMHSKLIRTHTVALGSDSCDYWYLGDKSEKLKKYEYVETV